MAKKLYGFNEKERADYLANRTITRTGKRQIHTYKKFERRGRSSGGGGGATETKIGWVFANIGKATSWDDMTSGTEPDLDWSVTPGQAGQTQPDDGSEYTGFDGVLLVDWATIASTKGGYLTAAYETPMTKHKPVVEKSHTDVTRWAWRRAINRSKSDIRASRAEPVGVAGYEDVKIVGTGEEREIYRFFIITDVMDLRALQNWQADKAMSVGKDEDGVAEWQEDTTSCPEE